MSKRRPARCPACGAGQVARIQYGLALFDKKLRRKLDAGDIVLGGCVSFDGDPQWECVACRHR